jgi:hypothetical protein
MLCLQDHFDVDGESYVIEEDLNEDLIHLLKCVLSYGQ